MTVSSTAAGPARQRGVGEQYAVPGRPGWVGADQEVRCQRRAAAGGGEDQRWAAGTEAVHLEAERAGRLRAVPGLPADPDAAGGSTSYSCTQHGVLVDHPTHFTEI